MMATAPEVGSPDINPGTIFKHHIQLRDSTVKGLNLNIMTDLLKILELNLMHHHDRCWEIYAQDRYTAWEIQKVLPQTQ